ncbi:DNA end-binding protein Ku [Baia soyae]|uniref:Non-homologous end joining protein Ku n=2 Tax=Baia soyae TaxID=1544746 RepID=A0A4R2S1M2_9BACL|nr:DNA end-binding protein Ku [Baia soyae]
MHTMWKGSISFGLVNIPIKMFAATEEKNVKFRYLHSKCQTPIQTVRTCPQCQQEVPWGEVVKGFEYADGKFVVMDEEEMAGLLPDANKAIEILDFVDLDQIDPIYFQKTYYLGSQDQNNKAYALLREALKESNKIGVAQITIRSKRSLAVIRVYQNCLVMETVHYPDEVRDVSMVPGVPEAMELPEKELQMAKQLIENLTTDFNPEQYHDEYRQAMQNAIEQKITGQEVVEAPARRPEKVIDLMEALRASLEATNSNKVVETPTEPSKKKITKKKTESPQKKSTKKIQKNKEA